MYAVVMAGGRGERFWPLSRNSRPKQFLKLTSDKTMLTETIERVLPLIPRERVRVVTGESMVGLIKDGDSQLSDAQILAEPTGRNTCLAIGLAAVHIEREDPNGVMVVLSADHLIRPQERLLEILAAGSEVATKTQQLITIGIVPTRPETGYGYVKLGPVHTEHNSANFYRVGAFVEKPKLTVAQEYYISREYLWNSGMFIWTASAILQAIKECQPEMSALLSSYAASIGTANEHHARASLYQQAASISIDYAVLEKATNVLTIKADIVWDDIGSWASIERYKDRDSDQNVIIGDAVTLDAYETTIYNDSQGVIAALGVSDLVIVRSGDITLVAHKSKVTEMKALLAKVTERADGKQYI